jgi:hypothetical protein
MSARSGETTTVTLGAAMMPGSWKTRDLPLPVGIDTYTGKTVKIEIQKLNNVH